jgi:hypothetical protein
VNASSATASALKAPRPRHGPELARLIASRAVVEGTTLAGFSGVCYYRASSPVRVRKAVVPGPRLLVVGQGRKVAKFRDGELVYDEQSFLVVTGETYFEAVVSEATAARPYLEMCMELPPEVVARTLLAVAHALESARELMLGGSIRVGEAAARVGYESASHFTRDFKLAYGAAPAEYSRRFRAGATR